jgi:hypothetical protein
MDERDRDEKPDDDDGRTRGEELRDIRVIGARERRLLRDLLRREEEREERAVERRADCRTLRVSIISALVVMLATFLLTGSAAPWWMHVSWIARFLGPVPR